MKPKLKPPGAKRLKAKCDILLSSSAFKFNLRRYNKEELWTRAMSGNQKSHLAGRSFRTCTPPTPPTLCADEPSARVVCKYEHSPWRYLYL